MGWYKPRVEAIEALPINIGTSMYKLYKFVGSDWTFSQEKRVAGGGLYVTLYNFSNSMEPKSITLEIHPYNQHYLVKQNGELFLVHADSFNKNYVRCNKDGN